MSIFFADVHELASILTGLQQVLPNLIIAPINENDYPDYYWINLVNKKVGYNRKQLSEALGDLDAVEYQLHKELSKVDELNLIVEGVGIATSKGVWTYQLSKDNRFFRLGYTFNKSPYLWQRYEGFKWSLNHKAGITVVETSTAEQTVQHLLASYRQSMNPEHTTLERYTIPHIPQMDKNPHIDNLIRLHGLGIGEVTAVRLIKQFGTFYNVMTAKYTDLSPVMGAKAAEKFLKGIGR